MAEHDRPGLLGRATLRKRLVVALWLAVAVAATARIGTMLADPILPGDQWQQFQSTRHFGDFREVVWTPGRHLLGGGNPYDPATYLVAHPWAQQFSPYPPVWLMLGVLLGPLPFLVSAAVFQVLALGVAVVALRVVCTWTLPRVADLAVPIGVLWLNIWYPGRGALASLGSVLVVLGVALVLRSVTRAAGVDGAGDRPGVDRACAAGVAIALVKPQFGVLVLLVAVLGGRFREAWRGVVAFVLACLPILIAVVVAAGGPVAFVGSLQRNLAHLSGVDSTGGLASPFQRRFDLLGGLAHFGLTEPPAWFSTAVPLVALGVVALVVRRTRDPFLVSTVVSTAVLLGFYHPWYDVVLMIVPVAVGIGMAVRGELSGIGARLVLGLSAFVVVHLHSVSAAVIPGLTSRGADTIDFVVVVVVFVVATACALVPTLRRHPATATAEAGSAGPR